MQVFFVVNKLFMWCKEFIPESSPDFVTSSLAIVCTYKSIVYISNMPVHIFKIVRSCDKA